MTRQLSSLVPIHCADAGEVPVYCAVECLASNPLPVLSSGEVPYERENLKQDLSLANTKVEDLRRLVWDQMTRGTRAAAAPVPSVPKAAPAALSTAPRGPPGPPPGTKSRRRAESSHLLCSARVRNILVRSDLLGISVIYSISQS